MKQTTLHWPILIFILAVSTQLFAETPVTNAFSTGTQNTALFGVHEVEVPGGSTSQITFTFTNGSKTYQVRGFYDNGSVIKARVYCDTLGTWDWESSTGQGGSFSVVPSVLKGKLRAQGKFLVHDNGTPFISIMDTAYSLFNFTDEDYGTTFYTTYDAFIAYVSDAAEYGATMLRVGAVGVTSFSETITIPGKLDNYYADTSYNSFNYENFQSDDQRIQWMLENRPTTQIQLILFGATQLYRSPDNELWPLGTAKRLKLLQFMVDRYSAYPNVNFLIYNDVDYAVAVNRSIVNEAGNFLVDNDPFNTLRSTGFLRTEDFDTSFYWANYYHLETRSDLSADSLDRSSYLNPVKP